MLKLESVKIEVMHDERSKHTPGPWVLEPNIPQVQQQNGDSIMVGPNCWANARLIAAAPDLLEVCEAIAALNNGQGRANLAQVAGQARQAIEAATGAK